MDPLLCLAPRAASRRPVTLRTILHVGALALLASGMCAVFASCKSAQVAQVQQAVAAVPTPSLAASETIRARTAAEIKKVVLAHPALGPWAYRFSTVCFQFSQVNLPSPTTLRAWLATAEIVAPDNIDQVLNAVMQLYEHDYQTAAVIQGTGSPYLLLLGEGIQDGIAQAGVQQKADTVVAFVVVGSRLLEDYHVRRVAGQH